MRPTWKKNLALLILSLAASLALAELALRLVHLPRPVASGWSWSDSPRRFLAHYGNDGGNELGFRGQPVRYGKEDYVVLLLGDSQVESATSPPERMPEQLLQRYLSLELKRPVKVFSLAASGFGQDQQLLALERYYRDYRADLVLVWATPDNDFWENSFPDRSTTSLAGHLKPTFRLVNGELQGPFYPGDFYYGRSALFQLLAQSYATLRGMTLEQMLLMEWAEHLPAGHGTPGNGALHEACGGLTPLDQKAYSEKRYDAKPGTRYLLMTGEDYQDSRSHFSPFLINRSPMDDYLVRLTGKLYQRLAATAKSHGSGFKVFLPDLADVAHSEKALVQCVQNPWEGSVPREVHKDEAALLEQVVPPGELIRFDLPGGLELTVSPQDGHLGDLGNDRSMRLLAPLLAH